MGRAKTQHCAVALYEIRVVIACVRDVQDNFVITPVCAVAVYNRGRYAVERQPDTVLVVDLDLLHVVLLVEKWLFLGLFAPVGQSCTEPPRLETVGHIEGDFLEFVAELGKLVPQRRV